MRVAVGGIGHETNTFSPLFTGLQEFRVTQGPEAVRGELWDRFRGDGVEFVPTLLAGAAPHGLIRRDAYLPLKAELLERLEQALPVDGVYLSLHGAMEVEEIGDGESDLLGAVRRLVGPDVLISASLDLHGNIAPAVVESADLLTALRTAPHRDGEETRARALSRVIHCHRERIRPAAAMVKLPLLLPGEYAVTDVEPAQSLYALLTEVEAQPGMLDASLMIGCAWTDSPYTSVAALAMAEADAELAHQHATRLAEAVWQQRAAFRPEVERVMPEEAVERALRASVRPVFISDSGDNVTAGAAGDLPLMAKHLLAAGAQDAVVAGLADEAAIRRCAEAGVGARVAVTLGGKLDRLNAKPLAVTGTLRRLDPPEAPSLAVLEVEGVTLVVTADRRAFTSRRSFEAAGIEPQRHAVVVVKQGYLFPELREIAALALMALTPGFTDLRLERLPYRRVRRPIYPLDATVEWEAAPSMR
jgi:microcystin degradation protein MlrC